MLEYDLSQHADTRMIQRGLRPEDVEAVLACRTRIVPDAFLMRCVDAGREVAWLKQRIGQIGRLKNWKVVVEGDTVITCYPSS